MISIGCFLLANNTQLGIFLLAVLWILSLCAWSSYPSLNEIQLLDFYSIVNHHWMFYQFYLSASLIFTSLSSWETKLVIAYKPRRSPCLTYPALLFKGGRGRYERSILILIRSSVALSFKVCESVSESRHPWQLSRSPLCSIYNGKSTLYWPSINNYQLVPPHSVPYWPSTQLHHLVTHSWANWI